MQAYLVQGMARRTYSFRDPSSNTRNLQGAETTADVLDLRLPSKGLARLRTDPGCLLALFLLCGQKPPQVASTCNRVRQ